MRCRGCLDSLESKSSFSPSPSHLLPLNPILSRSVSLRPMIFSVLGVTNSRIDIGATFKHAKEVLKKRSWKPSDFSEEKEGEGDRLYWLDGQVYRRLDERAWKMIFEGARARL